MSTLFTRNVLVVLGAVLIAELLTGLMIHFLILVPQTERVAGVMARTVAVVSDRMASMPDADRAKFLAELSTGSALRILPASGPPPEGIGRPGYLELKYMEALVQQLRDQRSVDWRSDSHGRLWIRVDLGGTSYWLTAEAPSTYSPINALVASLALTFVTSAAGGALLQRRFDRPLRRLARAADRVGTADGPGWIDETGPPEVARVARSPERDEPAPGGGRRRSRADARRDQP